MDKKQTVIAHFTSCLPKACGIATYVAALRKTMSNADPELKDFVVAIDDIEGGYRYGSDVKYHFWDKDLGGYKKAAEIINESDAQVVDIQHEFGLYGSKVNPETLGQDDGKNFLIFLNALKKPVVTTLHMVYKNPPAGHKKIMREICDKSLRIVVLSEISKKLLVSQYGILANKIELIRHGAPNVPKYSTSFFKEMIGFHKNEFLVSSFGLIRPKKGYEYLIEAISLVIQLYPNVKLLIAGRAHPQRSPEYYKMLRERVKELGLSQNVTFVNKFVDYSTLLNYLMATNVFVAPFTVMEQVSSGTLIYAMAAGRVCISTPFDYAKEALADKRGIIVPAEDSEAIAKKIIYLIKHPKVRHRMENLSYKYARGQTWFKTAKQYSNLFSKVVKE